MSGHYEYSDWLNQDVWVEDPPAAKVAPAAPVVAAGLPALAATQPAPAAAAPIAPVVATPVAPVTPVTSAPAAFDPKGNLDAATLAALQDAYAKQGVGGMQDIGGYDSNGQQQFVPTTANGFQINANLIANPNYVPQGADNSSPQSETMQGTNVASYSKQVGDNVYVYDTKGNLTSVVPTGGRWGGAIDMIKFLGPAILSGGLGGAAGAGSAMGLGTGTAATIGGGAALGAGTAALTGGDILKGALLGGLGGASNVGIGDTGATVGQVTSGVNLVKNLESGNLFGAITGAANIAGAGNTQIGETGLTINDLSKDANLAKAVISGNPQALMGALTSVASSATNSSNDANNLINQYTQTGAGTGAATTDYASNDVGTQQLIDALTNTPAATGQSVQVANNDNANSLAALEDAKTAAKIDNGQSIDLGTVGNTPPDAALQSGLNFPGDQSVPTQEQQQQSVGDLQTALAESQQSDTPTAPQDVIKTLQDAGLTNEQIGIPTPPSVPEAPAEPAVRATAPTQAEQQPAVEELIKQLEATQPAQTVEQIMASKPPPAVSQAEPAETPAETPTPEVTPEVQTLIDQAVTGQQESAQADQPAIDQQTQQLLSDLSGGTDTGVTPAETPRSIDNQIAADEQAKADAEAAQAETDKLASTHPDPVQALIDQVTNTDQPAIDQQTQDLLNELSGGTDNGVTSPIDYSGISDILSGGQTETPEEDIPTIDVIGKREPPTIDDSGISDILSGGQTETTPIDYSGISDILTGGQSETPPTEQAPAVSIPKIPTTTPAVAPVKTVVPVAKKPAAAAALASAIAQGYMPSVGDVAHIKSLESLFGPLLGEAPPEPAHEKKDDSLSALEGMDQEYASGGHVDDFSVEALLHILRS